MRPSSLFLAALTLLGACSSTRQARSVEPSGFLGDTSRFIEGTDDRPLLFTRTPGIDWSRYSSILCDSIEIRHAPDSSLADVSEEDLAALANALRAELGAALDDAWPLVDEPTEGTLRLRVALTDAARTRVGGNVVTTVVPMARNVSRAKDLATGAHLFVGAASIEIEIRDAFTNERLYAALDRRVGGKTFSGMTDPWSDVHEAFRWWALRLRNGLDEARENWTRPAG